MQDFQPVKKRRLSDDVIAQVRQRIASGELRPGDKLPAERDLAERFSVSRGAIREAMRNLENAGIVEIHHGVTGGAVIGRGDPAFMEETLKDLYHLGGVPLSELTQARIWIETLITRIACERGSDEDFAALAANVDEAEALYRAGQFDDKIAVNVEFHNLLARATHNSLMVMVMGGLMEVMQDVATGMGGERHDLTLKLRRKFLKLLKARDADGAARTMEKHLRELHERYAEIAKSRKQAEDGTK